MAKVEAFSKLCAIVTLLHCVAVVTSVESEQKPAQQRTLNKTSTHLTSMEIKELKEQNNWQIIDLSHNSIEFIDPPELLRSQTALEALLLDYNEKFGASGSGTICEHKHLKRMSCKACGFARIQTKNFAGCERLEELVLSANQIERIDGDAFKENYYLRILDLSANKLKVLQVSTFAGLTKFEELNLSENPIELPPTKHFLKSNSLKSLYLDSCKLGDIYSQTFTEMKSLVRLRLNANKIESIPVNAFNVNENLTSLFIEDNRLKFFPANTLDYLSKLSELCIDGNNYTNNKEFQTLLSKYNVRRLRTQNCKSDMDTMIEHLFKGDENGDNDVTVDTPSQNATDEKLKKIHEGISDFFIGSYLTVILIVQAIAFVLLTLYFIKITKYEKLGGGSDINYANTILNDNDIYKVFKLNDE